MDTSGRLSQTRVSSVVSPLHNISKDCGVTQQPNTPFSSPLSIRKLRAFSAKFSLSDRSHSEF
jgi:hypothetical protein